MNGRVARNIRKYAHLRWTNLSPEYQVKAPIKLIIKLFKEQYYKNGRSF